jgi:hypothetical protein
VPQPSSTRKELDELEKALGSESKTVNIRLREGEYQFSLAKATASFELELRFPNVKDLVKKLFGEKKTEDLQFVSKIQTILKKMEKSGVIRILTKEKPWELQRYALSSFKFQDIEKNLVVLAEKSEIDKTLDLIHSRPNSNPSLEHLSDHVKIWTSLLILATISSYASIIWTLFQPTINLIIFGLTFCIAAGCSTLLGIFISRRSKHASES